jgi:hypothetical protein
LRWIERIQQVRGLDDHTTEFDGLRRTGPIEIGVYSRRTAYPKLRLYPPQIAYEGVKLGSKICPGKMIGEVVPKILLPFRQQPPGGTTGCIGLQDIPVGIKQSAMHAPHARTRLTP